MELNITNYSHAQIICPIACTIPKTEENARKLEKIIDSESLTLSQKMDIVTYDSKFAKFS